MFSTEQPALLDAIAVLLAIVAILLALGGLYAFLSVRGTAKKEARQAAIAEARRLAERTANDYLQAEMPALIREYTELARAIRSSGWGLPRSRGSGARRAAQGGFRAGNRPSGAKRAGRGLASPRSRLL